MCQREQLIQAHPIFGLEQLNIYWCDTVQFVNPKGSTKSHLFAVTTAGLFVFEKRTFPRSIFISKYIPFSELLLVRVEDGEMQFCCPKISLVLRHPDYVVIVSLVLGIRNALFGTKTREPKVVVTAEIESNEFAFRTDHLLSDRFLSLCGKIPKRVFSCEQVCDVYQQLTREKVVTISGELMASPCFGPLVEAVACDDSVKHLIFTQLSFCSAVEGLTELFLTNTSVKKVTFRNVVFCGELKWCVEEDKMKFRPGTIIFDESELNTPEFLQFWEKFPLFSNHVTRLSFFGCNFTKKTLEGLFQSMFMLKCFRDIEVVEFSDVKIADAFNMCLLQFFGSNLFLINRNLRILRCKNCQLQPGEMFGLVSEFENSIRTVDFSRNFMFSFKGPIKSWDALTEIHLSSCIWTGDAFVELMTALSTSENHIERLFLDDMRVDSEEDYRKIYEGLAKAKGTQLQVLSWSKNDMRLTEVEKFVEFVMHQPKLVHLVLSECIHEAEALRPLEQMVSEKKIETFVMRGRGKTILGRNLLPVLRAFLTNQSLKTLDVIGQCIGNEGLIIICQLAKTSLNSVFFDGSRPSTVDALTDCCNILIASPLVQSVWPEWDVKRVLSKVNAVRRLNLQEKIDKLESDFKAKLCKSGKAVIYDIDTLHRRSDLENSNPGLEMIPSLLGWREDNIQRQLNECLEGSPELKNEALLTAFNEIIDNSSLDYYIQHHSK